MTGTRGVTLPTLLSVICLMSAGASTAQSAGLIKFNKSVGEYRLGMSLKELNQLTSFPRAGCGNEGPLFLCADKRSGLTSIAIQNSAGASGFKTAKGIRIGSTRAELSRAYPNLKCFEYGTRNGKLVSYRRYDAREIRTRDRRPWTCKLGQVVNSRCLDTRFAFRDGRSATVKSINMSSGGSKVECTNWPVDGNID